MKKTLCTICFAIISFAMVAQDATEANRSKDSIMITVFLKHQQDKNLAQIEEVLEKNNFWAQFPPKSAKVVSWYVMMGIGQVVTLKIPGGALRELNLTVEKSAWGAFDSEFYPTYDLSPVVKQKKSNLK